MSSVLGRAAQLPGHRDDLGQFRRALDRRMARQDLLEQGRARARHADDEDRVGGRAAAAGARGEELPREDRLERGGPAPCSGPRRRDCARGAAHCPSRSARKRPRSRPRPRSALPSAKCEVHAVRRRRPSGRRARGAWPRGRPSSKRKVFRLARLQYASPKAGSSCERSAGRRRCSRPAGPRSSARGRSSARPWHCVGYSASKLARTSGSSARIRRRG